MKESELEISDDLSIPKFLRVTEADKEKRRKAAQLYSQTHKTETIAERYDSRKPASMSWEEWDRRQVERKEEERRTAERLEVERQARKPPKPEAISRAGKRWDQRKGRWVDDPLAHLAGPAPAASVKAPRSLKPVPRKTVPANSFGIPEGTNRDKLARAMAKRIGELVPLTDWSKVVYGSENNAAACGRVMDGFIYVLKKNKLKFEIIKDKNEHGQIVFGLFETE